MICDLLEMIFERANCHSGTFGWLCNRSCLRDGYVIGLGSWTERFPTARMRDFRTAFGDDSDCQTAFGDDFGTANCHSETFGWLCNRFRAWYLVDQLTRSAWLAVWLGWTKEISVGLACWLVRQQGNTVGL